MKTIIEQLTHRYENNDYDNDDEPDEPDEPLRAFAESGKRITTSLGDICFRTENLMLQREVEDFLELVKQKYN